MEKQDDKIINGLIKRVFQDVSVGEVSLLQDQKKNRNTEERIKSICENIGT